MGDLMSAEILPRLPQKKGLLRNVVDLRCINFAGWPVGAERLHCLARLFAVRTWRPTRGAQVFVSLLPAPQPPGRDPSIAVSKPRRRDTR